MAATMLQVAVPRELRAKFKAYCSLRNTTMRDEIVRFMERSAGTVIGDTTDKEPLRGGTDTS